MQKDLVQLYWTGYRTLSIHGRDPATARHGDFCLLRFRPGPVRLSLGNLDGRGSPRPTILMPGLARTPGRHRPAPGRCPGLKPSTDPGLRVAGLQEYATTPGRLDSTLIAVSFLTTTSRRSTLNFLRALYYFVKTFASLIDLEAESTAGNRQIST